MKKRGIKGWLMLLYIIFLCSLGVGAVGSSIVIIYTWITVGFR